MERRGLAVINRLETDKTIELATTKFEPLLIRWDDHLCNAMFDVLMGANVLFAGETGTGKTVRANALTFSDNYRKILGKFGMEEVTVNIEALEVDMIPVLAPLELQYENRIENGTSRKNHVLLSDFILRHGFASRRDFEDLENQRIDTLKNRQGTIDLKVVLIDDFDRTTDVSVTNAFMKFINNDRHILFDGQERWLNLQCIATSNSACGRPASGYLGSKGIDIAIGNRFQMYTIPKANLFEILAAEFPLEMHEFIRKITALVDHIKEEMQQGVFSALGEVTLRQMRNCVRLVAHCGVDQKAAASRLLAGIGADDEERAKADALVERYFGSPVERKRNFVF